MANYITLEHLDQTTWSLVQKINQLADRPIIDERITTADIANWNSKPSMPTIQSAINSSISSALNGFHSMDVQIVDSLPSSGDTGTFYFVPLNDTNINNYYEEYIYLSNGGGWEKIGTTQIDLSDYVTNSGLTSALSNYATTASLNDYLKWNSNIYNSNRGGLTLEKSAAITTDTGHGTQVLIYTMGLITSGASKCSRFFDACMYENDGYTTIKINSGAPYAQTNPYDGETYIYKIVTPTSDDMAANKLYVDNKYSALTSILPAAGVDF